MKIFIKRIVHFFRAKMYTRAAEVSWRIDAAASGSLIIPAAAPGGTGDDAMVNGAIAAVSTEYLGERVSVLVPKKFPADFRFAREIEHIDLFSNWTHPVVEAAKLVEYKRTYVLGADILDGAYNLPDAIKRIRLAGICAEQGQDSRIVGFSLNENPHPAVLREFKRLKNVPLFLRDPLSFERAKRLIGGDVRLSADVAFLLEPVAGEHSASVERFAAQARVCGNRVYGLNIHDLLARFSSEGTFDRLISSIAKMIVSCKDCSFVFIPHDYRQTVDDRAPLQRVYDSLDHGSRQRVLFVSEPIRAAEIKQICKSLDGVLTGRMHLGIAALGVGVPVMGIVYQGKFEGTLSYFDLDKEFMLSPEQAADYELLKKRFGLWVAGAESISEKIRKNLPTVKKLAASNFQ